MGCGLSHLPVPALIISGLDLFPFPARVNHEERTDRTSSEKPKRSVTASSLSIYISIYKIPWRYVSGAEAERHESLLE